MVWMKNNVGKVFELHHVPPIVEACLDESARAHNIKMAFEKTGVYKFNPTIFTDDEFISAELIADAEFRARGNVEEDTANQRAIVVLEEDIPAGSFEEVSTSGTSSMHSSLNAVGPVGMGTPRVKSNRGRKPMASAILTSSEKLNELQEQADKREATKRKKEQKQTPPAEKGPPAKKAAKNKKKVESTSSSEEDDCLLCSKPLPKNLNRNNSIKCNTCKETCHMKCANFPNNFFTCPECDSDLDDTDDEQ